MLLNENLPLPAILPNCRSAEIEKGIRQGEALPRISLLTHSQTSLVLSGFSNPRLI
jgi:hypothetical protein